MVQKSPANSKVKIFVGDTFTKSFEHRISDVSNLNNTRGLPGTVTSAIARVYDTTSAAYLPIGGVGVYEEACTVTPPTGATERDVGSIISYTVSSIWTSIASDLALFITFTYDNDQVTTQKYRFRVTEKR